MVSSRAIGVASAVLVSLGVLGAMATNPVFLMGEPSFFGSGCPAGTVRVAPSMDGQTVSILFDEYAAATTPSTNRDRKACNVAVPVSILPGISIGIFQVDFRGYAFVPPVERAFVEFQANYFFAGATGPTYKKTWATRSDEDLFLSNKLGVSAVVWSPCGQSANFRINTALMAYKPKLSDEDAQIAIDSTDITVERGFRFFVTFRVCDSKTLSASASASKKN